MPISKPDSRPLPEGSPIGWSRGLLLTILAILAACGSSDGPFSETNPRPDPSADLPADRQERLPPPGEAWIIFESDTVQVEVARTAEEREQGLMYREALDLGRGMLFVFTDAQYRSFWMRNTFIPLDIAYIDENLTIIDIQAMEPETETGHPSAKPAMFALEVPQGWFAAKGIHVGAQAKLVFGPG